MKPLLLLLQAGFILTLSHMIHAKDVTVQFDTIPVHAKYPKYFTGALPQIQGKAYQQLNLKIQKQLYQDLDQGDFYIDIETKKIYQNSNFLSYETFLNISDLTSRYKSFYYTVDLKNKKIISFEEYLNQHNMSKLDINLSLKTYIQQCHDDNPPDHCLDEPFYSMMRKLGDKENLGYFFQLDNLSSFYLKHDILGLSFEGNKYTYAFEYDLKTHQIHSQPPSK